jgi:hypothetical protein
MRQEAKDNSTLYRRLPEQMKPDSFGGNAGRDPQYFLS